MEKDRLLLIINPISGVWDKQGLDSLVMLSLQAQGYAVDVKYTTGKGDATQLALDAVSNGYFGVIAAGGDGTVNETASALCGTKTALGIVPTGSGNGLARHLGIPIDPELSLEVIARRHVVDCDYGTVNGLPFFCTFGVGFDAAVSGSFAKQRKRGKFTYIKSAISEYVKYNPQVYTISANGKILTEKAFIIACCNASQYGNNAYIAPEANITDGLLDITIVHAGSPLDTAVLGVDLFSGYINRNTLIHTFRAPAAVIYRSSGGPIHLDGEPLEMDEIMEVKCHRKALKIFTPTSVSRFRPIVTPINSFFQEARIAISHVFGIGK